MRMRYLAVGLTAAVALGVLAAAAFAAPSDGQTLNITAIVVNQQCQGGDFVNVTLSGTGNSSSTPMFAWDYTSDGTIDTGALARPRVMHLYPDEVTVTATLFARNQEGDRDRDSVTFGTLNCP